MLGRLFARISNPISRRSSTKNRRLGLESLERRALMAASILDGFANQAEGEGPSVRIINGTVTTAYPSVGLVGDNTATFALEL